MTVSVRFIVLGICDFATWSELNKGLRFGAVLLNACLVPRVPLPSLGVFGDVLLHVESGIKYKKRKGPIPSKQNLFLFKECVDYDVVKIHSVKIVD